VGRHGVRDLVGRPDVERALLSLAVRVVDRRTAGVQRRVEAAVRVAEFAVDEPERLPNDVGVALVPEQPIAVDVRPNERGLVVQHLLEVRDRPVGVRAVAVEAAAEVVVEAAGGHRVERVAGDVAVLAVAALHVVGADDGVDATRLRELRRAAEPAVVPVCGPGERARRVVEWAVLAEVGSVREVLQFSLRRAQPLLRAVLEVLTLGPPRVGDVVEQLEEPWLVPFRLLREVRPHEERLLVGCEERRQGPPTATADDLADLYVQCVDVRALLAVDFHRDEVLVQGLCDLLVGERLLLHHVTPVARRVADGEEDRDVAFSRALEGRLVPRLPVHWVVRVLPEVRARRLVESVAARRVRHNCLSVPRAGKSPRHPTASRFPRRRRVRVGHESRRA
jgi:hypothetical protein